MYYLDMSTKWLKTRTGFFVKGLSITTLIVSIGAAYFSSHHIGIDNQGITCLPYRVYIIDIKDKSVKRNGYVNFVMDDRGAPFFKNGQPFIKKVIGVPGDKVDVTAKGLFINGKFIKQFNQHVLSIIKKKTGKQVAQRERHIVLAKGEYWGFGSNPRSFDSMYWGRIYQRQVTGIAKPIF